MSDEETLEQIREQFRVDEDALEAEAERPDPRRERIAALNQRVAELREVDT